MALLGALLAAASLVALLPPARPFKIPSYVKNRCVRTDPNLNKCALEQARHILPHVIGGDPTLRVPVLDPFRVEKIDLAPQGSSTTVGLQVSCIGCDIRAVSKAVLNDVRINLKKKVLTLDIYFPQILLTGNYEAKGKVLLLPVVGKGDGSIQIDKVNANVDLMFDYVKKKKDTYIKVSNYKVDYTVDHLKLHLNNLFNGNKMLGDNMNNFLNENWRDLLADMRQDISDIIGQIIQNTVNQVFSSIPFDVLLPPSV